MADWRYGGADMARADNDNRVQQIAVGAGILLVLALTACGALVGWRHLPGLLGDWLGFILGVLTTPFLLEAAVVTGGLTIVLALNYWRQRRAGDDFVDLDQPSQVGAPRQLAANELRFTRSGQAVGFWLAAAVLAAGAVTLGATALYRDINPDVPHPAWALVPLGLALLAARLARHLTRHAYLILTPLGIEILPFFRPAARLRMVGWQEVAAAEVNAEQSVLTLHYDAAKTAGIHLSLKPIRADRRALLVKAVCGRCAGQ